MPALMFTLKYAPATLMRRSKGQLARRILACWSWGPMDGTAFKNSCWAQLLRIFCDRPRYLLSRLAAANKALTSLHPQFAEYSSQLTFQKVLRRQSLMGYR